MRDREKERQAIETALSAPGIPWSAYNHGDSGTWPQDGAECLTLGAHGGLDVRVFHNPRTFPEDIGFGNSYPLVNTVLFYAVIRPGREIEMTPGDYAIATIRDEAVRRLGRIKARNATNTGWLISFTESAETEDIPDSCVTAPTYNGEPNLDGPFDNDDIDSWELGRGKENHLE